MAARMIRMLGTAAAALCVAFVGLGATGGWLYWDRVEWNGEQAARAELPALAAEEMPKVLGYDYQTVERSLTETYPLFTPGYRHEFQERATKDVIPQAREKRLVNRIDVVGVGVLAARRTSGSVLVYVNRTVVDQSKKEFYDGSRLRVDYQKVHDKWLIDNMMPI